MEKPQYNYRTNNSHSGNFLQVSNQLSNQFTPKQTYWIPASASFISPFNFNSKPLPRSTASKSGKKNLAKPTLSYTNGTPYPLGTAPNPLFKSFPDFKIMNLQHPQGSVNPSASHYGKSDLRVKMAATSAQHYQQVLEDRCEYTPHARPNSPDYKPPVLRQAKELPEKPPEKPIKDDPNMEPFIIQNGAPSQSENRLTYGDLRRVASAGTVREKSVISIPYRLAQKEKPKLHEDQHEKILQIQTLLGLDLTSHTEQIKKIYASKDPKNTNFEPRDGKRDAQGPVIKETAAGTGVSRISIEFNSDKQGNRRADSARRYQTKPLKAVPMETCGSQSHHKIHPRAQTAREFNSHKKVKKETEDGSIVSKNQSLDHEHNAESKNPSDERDLYFLINNRNGSARPSSPYRYVPRLGESKEQVSYAQEYREIIEQRLAHSGLKPRPFTAAERAKLTVTDLRIEPPTITPEYRPFSSKLPPRTVKYKAPTVTRLPTRTRAASARISSARKNSAGNPGSPILEENGAVPQAYGDLRHPMDSNRSMLRNSPSSEDSHIQEQEIHSRTTFSGLTRPKTSLTRSKMPTKSHNSKIRPQSAIEDESSVVENVMELLKSRQQAISEHQIHKSYIENSRIGAQTPHKAWVDSESECSSPTSPKSMTFESLQEHLDDQKNKLEANRHKKSSFLTCLKENGGLERKSFTERQVCYWQKEYDDAELQSLSTFPSNNKARAIKSAMVRKSGSIADKNDTNAEIIERIQRNMAINSAVDHLKGYIQVHEDKKQRVQSAK